MALPLLVLLAGADLFVDADGRVTHNPAALERERQFFELRDRADGMRKTPGIAPEQTIAVYEQALTALGDRDDTLRVDVLRRIAETYADAAYANMRIIGRAGEEALSASGGDVDAMLEAMQEVFEAANEGRPDRHYAEKLIEQYKVVAAEAAEIDPLLSARALMEAARGASSIREHEDAALLWNEALVAAQTGLADPSLDADEREEWGKVRLHSSNALTNLGQIAAEKEAARSGGLERTGARDRDLGIPKRHHDGNGDGPAAGGEGLSLDDLATMRAEGNLAEAAGARENYEVTGWIDQHTPVLRPVAGTTIPQAIALINSVYSIRLCTEYERYSENEIAPFPFRVRTGQRLIDALDDLAAHPSGLIEWRLKEGRIVVIIRSEVTRGDLPVLDYMVDWNLHASTIQDALLELEAASNIQLAEFLGTAIITDTSCVELQEPFHFSEESRHVPFVLQERMSIRGALLKILAATGDKAMSYRFVRRDAVGRADAFTNITVSTRPCRDQWETSAEYEQAAALREERVTRREQYQQAIDEARAAAERERKEAAE